MFLEGVPTIETFKELLNEIAWSWQYPNYDLHYDKTDNRFYINKLSIFPDHIEYKGQYEKLSPGVFEELQKFHAFLNGGTK